MSSKLVLIKYKSDAKMSRQHSRGTHTCTSSGCVLAMQCMAMREDIQQCLYTSYLLMEQKKKKKNIVSQWNSCFKGKLDNSVEETSVES